VTLKPIALVVSRCRETGPLKMAALDAEETKLMFAMK
jgi:hypothetical protein